MKLSVATSVATCSLVDSQSPDTYFTAGYGIAAASLRRGQWQAVYWEDRIVLPYIVCEVEHGCLDAASPYGYSGVYISPACRPSDVARFWAAARGYWRDLGLISVFLRFSPLDPGSRAAASCLPHLDMTRRGDTVTVALRDGVEAAWTDMEGRSRTAIRKAMNAGLTGRIQPAGAGNLARSSSFRRLYEQTMMRVRSSPAYLFADEYYSSLSEGLGDGLLLAEVLAPEGDTAAAALVLSHRERAHYHLAGSTREGATVGANNLLVWTIMQWAANNDKRLVHLGGGLAPDDGLFRFKRSFGGRRTQFWTGATVVDPSAYAALVERRAVAAGTTPDVLRGQDFFPAYRFGSVAL